MRAVTAAGVLNLTAAFNRFLLLYQDIPVQCVWTFTPLCATFFDYASWLENLLRKAPILGVESVTRRAGVVFRKMGRRVRGVNGKPRVNVINCERFLGALTLAVLF